MNPNGIPYHPAQPNVSALNFGQIGNTSVKDLPGFEETFDVSAAQITIADLEAQTGLDFGDLKITTFLPKERRL